jgi:CDP-diacylglycerol--serine O-phosphatidyltransferase
MERDRPSDAARGKSDAAPHAGPAGSDPRAVRLARRQARRERTRRRILRSTAVLPGLFTVSNGLLGFAAIYLATRGAIGSGEPSLLPTAAWLLFGAMVCDLLDGRLARFTRRTSDFGAQLDSLCDVISFGVAPPILMLQAVMGVVAEHVASVPFLARVGQAGIERILWCVAGVYVAGAALRLARFNVENEPDESAHMDFRGLPSPGAAAAVASLVLLFDHVKHVKTGGWILGPVVQQWLSAPGVLGGLTVALPVVCLAAGLLMVSRFRYAHVVNQYIRGRRPFNYLVKLVLLAMLVLLEPYVALAGAATVYVLSGPIGAAWRRLRGRGGSAPAAAELAEDDASRQSPESP